MQRVSSNLTLPLKIFFPTAWLAFFGPLTVAMLLAENASLPFGGGTLIRYGFLAGFILFFALIYFFLLPLKRVEFSEDGVYVTNYFKTYRYPYSSIKCIKENDLGIITVARIYLKEKGSFGRKINFILSRVNYHDYINQHTELFVHLFNQDHRG